jgi:hypothetical protein
MTARYACCLLLASSLGQGLAQVDNPPRSLSWCISRELSTCLRKLYGVLLATQIRSGMTESEVDQFFPKNRLRLPSGGIGPGGDWSWYYVDFGVTVLFSRSHGTDLRVTAVRIDR